MRIWKYECDAGSYSEISLLRLLWAIHKHRWHHYMKSGVYED